MEKRSNNHQLDLNSIIRQLGEFGPYQLQQHCLHGLSWLLASIHMMGFVFIFPVMDHRCYVKQVDGYHYENINISTEMQMYIPRNPNGQNFESCSKFDPLNGTIPCDEGYVYSSKYFHSSRVADWDLVCDKNWMRALLQSIFLLGTLIGSSVCGYLADKYGRKPVFVICGIVQCLCGVACVFLNSYIAFAFAMFWYGLFGSAGSVVCSIVLTMEIVGPTMRSPCGTFFTMWFGCGAIIVATWAYVLPVEAKVLQLILAMHSILLFGHYWFMDESICWLWSKGKKEEALRIARKALKYNGKKLDTSSSTRQTTTESSSATTQSENQNSCECKKTPDKIVKTLENDTSAVEEADTLNLFRFPKLRRRTLVMIYCWFASCLTYFGLSFNSVNLVGNPYLMFILTILAEIPGHLISIFGTAKTGNKPMFATSLFISGISCVIVPLVPKGLMSTALTMVAKVTATICFNVICSYTAELFPTNLRNTAIGFCMMSARTGAAIIPLINLLATTAEEIPTITFGVVGIIACAMTLLFLPETMNKEIPQTIEDVEKTKSKKSSAHC